MPTLTSNGIDISYQASGDPKGLPLLLVMGLGMQLVAWPDELVDGLAELGFHVIRFDNRDSGLSTKFDAAGIPSVPLAIIKSFLRLPVKPVYTLDDMAADALGVLDALGVARAHVVGASMGGMIAQTLAARHPGRVLSLTSIMSSSGRRGLPGPSKAARKALMRRTAGARDHEGRVEDMGENMSENMFQIMRAIGSPAYPTPPAVLRARIARAMGRNVCAGGVARQMHAIIAHGDRSALLAAIRAPTLVIHGAADPLVPPACGVDTADKVPGARLVLIEGMGHDLPAQLIERLLALIDAHAHGNMSPDSTLRLFEKQ
ncbi:alpha/beta fold hydrolase [Massilia glaciei]|uniref:Alpha/beta hydrolase n=1 Tax=Massilia glaciei TaxID=1524097 RepID=A0A2U2HJJ4_9BURK|nr:alpha/beta hydrolase [Massilia glaciei]PWF47680.1 alpha/beta hydrolase [Massilia glaciei]